MYIKVVTMVIGTLMLSFSGHASETETLDEAEAYIQVNPAKTLEILRTQLSPDKLGDSEFIRWHLLNTRATLQTNQIERMYVSLEALFTKDNVPYFKTKLTSIMSALGIWLRRENYLEEALISLNCSYKYTTSERQRLTLMNSMALVYRQLNDYSTARASYDKAKEIANKLNQESIVAMIENNLGLMDLDEGNVRSAEQHFRLALASYQSTDKRSGQISAGINLLFTFLIQNELLNYQRLYQPTATLTEAFPNIAKQHLLLWLNSYFEHLQGKVLSDDLRHQLISIYPDLESDKIRRLVNNHLSHGLHISLPEPEEKQRKPFTQPWFDKVRKCQWRVDNSLF
ncbi:tetratricopeptide repeat protein [Pseudoalteromonas sp. T1lg65]|uniref:tetratricopeptide repeat protein n=1 Tax=Pseudoalteromonas sp. T1lg65 TaxID=2077101 RepID=UPI003F7A025B